MLCPRSDGLPCDSDCVPDGDDRAVERILSLFACPVCGGKAVCLEVDDGEAVLGCAARKSRYKIARWGTGGFILPQPRLGAPESALEHYTKTPWRVPLTAAGAQPGGGEE